MPTIDTPSPVIDSRNPSHEYEAAGPSTSKGPAADGEESSSGVDELPFGAAIAVADGQAAHRAARQTAASTAAHAAARRRTIDANIRDAVIEQSSEQVLS